MLTLIDLSELRAVRCGNCRNRVGPDAAHVLGDGLLVCERCASRIRCLEGPGGAVELVGD